MTRRDRRPLEHAGPPSLVECRHRLDLSSAELDELGAQMGAAQAKLLAK